MTLVAVLTLPPKPDLLVQYTENIAPSNRFIQSMQCPGKGGLWFSLAVAILPQ